MDKDLTTWVMLRGLMRETRHWGEFPQIFRKQLPGSQVETLDLPGNGKLHNVSSPLSVEAMAEYARRELSARGISPPYRLLGLSMGAMVAVAWAARHPEDLRGCVLINSSMGGFDPFYRRMKPRTFPTLLSLAGAGVEQHERALLRLTSCNGDSQSEILAAWVSYGRDCPVSRRNALRQLVAAATYRAPARRPDTPMLVLASALDRLVDTRCSRHLAIRWNTALAIHPRAGHDLPLDDGPWVAKKVRDWLAEIG